MIPNVDDRTQDPSFMGRCEFVVFSVLVLFMYKTLYTLVCYTPYELHIKYIKLYTQINIHKHFFSLKFIVIQYSLILFI